MKKSTGNSFTYLYTSIFLFFVAIATFSYVTIEIQKTTITNFDNKVITYVQSYVNPKLTSIIGVLTEIGSVKIVVIFVFVLGAILFFKKRIALSIFVIGASTAGGVFNLLLKSIIQRERPDILRIVEASGYSFPSGHSMGSIIFYGSLAFVIIYFSKSKLTKLLTIVVTTLLVLFIGVSRIYLGVHYPTDVVAGFAFGSAWLLICITTFRYYEWRKDAGVLYVRQRN